MLKLKYLFENYDLAKEALKNWRYDTDTLDNILSQFRISSNMIYPFFQDGNVCLLRLSPVDEKIEKNILGELEFLNYLKECEYPALKIQKAKTGDDCLTLTTKWGDYYAVVFERVSGTQLDDIALSDEVMHQYGKALGRLHSLSAKFTPKTKKWTHEEALDWIEMELQKYNAPQFVFTELRTVKSELSALPQDSDNYGLVHYDFELDNVFYDEEIKKCFVIDFEDGMYHWFALDIEQVFDSITNDAENFSSEELIKAKEEFLRGYREEHIYSEEMELSLPIMRRFINLFGYTRLIRCVAEKISDEPEWMIGLRNKLDNAIKQKEASMKAQQ